MELAPQDGGRDTIAGVERRVRSRSETGVKPEPETPPKDLTTLTFFLTAAYTQAAMEALGHERRMRGQERRDGL